MIIATGEGLPKTNPKPWEGILPPYGDVLVRGNPPARADCEKVEALRPTLTTLIQSGRATPNSSYEYPDGLVIPRQVEIYYALVYYRPYFWARRSVAVPLRGGTLYAGHDGWEFEPSSHKTEDN